MTLSSIACGAPGSPFRLGRVHSVPTVSSAFLALHSLPRALKELKGVPLSLLDRALSIQMFSRVFPGVAPEEQVRLKTNNSAIQLLSVLSGGGVAWIPSYVHAVVRGLHVVPVENVFSSDIWLSRRQTSIETARADRLWDWVIGNFDHKTCPWFRDEYLPPETFAEAYRGVQLSLA